ncbi:MAG: hypothetical protein OEY09_12875 [Gammaproteobacteria bacterium]|nr:hypothetical protein [Gammaproteobacteria bacterium]
MKSKLRNFELSVEEIKIVKLMEQLIEGLDNLEVTDPLSPRADFFRTEIQKLEEKLEEVREHTLIKF